MCPMYKEGKGRYEEKEREELEGSSQGKETNSEENVGARKDSEGRLVLGERGEGKGNWAKEGLGRVGVELGIVKEGWSSGVVEE
ncbi:hypothetical protein ACH5RR_025547 [Cinchona calisaya]|uniref:Uncharacterized protein n=1 Tax=Cinchona calisaya TaxID=153742 RepID=A0ABD2Z3B7_9GENT